MRAGARGSGRSFRTLACLCGLIMLAGASRLWGAESGLPSDKYLEQQAVRIGRIEFERQTVFDELVSHGRLLRAAANHLHATTRESVLREQLLFKEGDRYRARLLAESERLLRRQPYLFDAHITKIAYHDGVVDLRVWTKEVWTLYPEFSLSRSGGANSSAFGIEDDNVFGSGATIVASHHSTVDRRLDELSLSDNNIAGTRIVFNGVYANNSDGNDRYVDLERPFYAFDARYALGGSAFSYVQTDSLYDLGTIIDQFQERAHEYTAYAGWSTGLLGAFVHRFTAGVTHDEHHFLTLAAPIGPSLLPTDRRYVYPWIGYELQEDRYVVLQNTNQLARDEDYALGPHLTARLGWASSAWGSLQPAFLWSSAGGYGARPSPGQLLLLSAGFSGRRELGRVDNAVSNLRAQWYWQERTDWVGYVSAARTKGERLDLDNQILLGGDTGLRGYPLRFQDGTTRYLVTIEQRYFSPLYLWHLARVGAAAFLDVGRMAGAAPLASPNQSVLSDVGVGLRLGSSAFANLAHIDLAMPLDVVPGVAKLQLLISFSSNL